MTIQFRYQHRSDLIAHTREKYVEAFQRLTGRELE
jgi:hypothetical protein